MKKLILCLSLIIFAFIANGLAQSKTKKSTQKKSQTSSGIRKVDFKNFKYNSSCLENLVLRKGHAKYGDSDYDVADLSSVKYIDFDGDGKEDAFVVIEWLTSGSSGGGIEAFVFTYRDGSAQQIWSKCNERSSAVLTGRSILFTYPEYVGDDAHCCPTYTTTDTYAWKGSVVARISKKRKRNK